MDVNIICEVVSCVALEPGPVSLSTIRKHLNNKNTQISRENLKMVLMRYPQQFEISRTTETHVLYRPSLDICEKHCSKTGCTSFYPLCSNLHICKFFVLTGKCKFRNNCTYGHDLTTSHNAKVISANFLNCLPSTSVIEILRKNKNNLGAAKPKICAFYNKGENSCRNSATGKKCPFLHLCRYHVKGSCSFGVRCKRNHNVHDLSVVEILQKHGMNTNHPPHVILSELSEVIDDGSDDGSVNSAMALRDSDPMVGIGRSVSQLDLSRPGHHGARPRTASSNKGGGRHGASSASRRQRQPQCDSSVTKLPAESKDQNQHVCIFHLKGLCRFGEACFNWHSDQQYEWFYRREGQTSWKTFKASESVDLEKQFCDPAISDFYLELGYSGMQYRLDFQTMVAKCDDHPNLEFYRISTESSIKLDTQPLATCWVWYWQGQMKDWKKYGDNDSGYSANITSDLIEQAYLDNPTGQMAFATDGHEYVLDFKTFRQRNLHYGTERTVTRRPVFVSMEELQKLKLARPKHSRSRNPSGPPSIRTAPGHWTIGPSDDLLDHYKVVPVNGRSPYMSQEYKEIERIFCESMPNAVHIKSIDRVENGELWDNYMNKKEKMLKKRLDSELGERRLFHGTRSDKIDGICTQGFDFRLNGTSVGTKHGKGSYFAVTSRYSDCYTDQKDRTIFIAKVLIGDYVQGNKDYSRPPSKDPTNPNSPLYDSCVDKVAKPEIFVVFDNNQVYPEYVIKYSF